MSDQLELFDVKMCAAGGTNRRTMLRHKTNWPALCYAEGMAAEVRVGDVSDGGLGLESELPFEKDQIIRIDLYGVGVYTCRVAWIGRGRSGLEFMREDDELSDAAVADLAAHIVSLGKT